MMILWPYCGRAMLYGGHIINMDFVQHKHTKLHILWQKTTITCDPTSSPPQSNFSKQSKWETMNCGHLMTLLLLHLWIHSKCPPNPLLVLNVPHVSLSPLSMTSSMTFLFPRGITTTTTTSWPIATSLHDNMAAIKYIFLPI